MIKSRNFLKKTELVNYGKKSIDHIDKSSRREQFWYTCKWVCKGSKRSGAWCGTSFFEKASLKGMVGGGGIDAANTAEDHVDIMKKAYELGKNL